MLGGRSLDGLGDVLLGTVGGEFARFGIEPLHQVRCVVTRFALDLLEQQFLGFVGREAGDALELVLLLRDEAFVLGLRRLRRLLPRTRGPLSCLKIPVESLGR